jgi:hypothetical protein
MTTLSIVAMTTIHRRAAPNGADIEQRGFRVYREAGTGDHFDIIYAGDNLIEALATLTWEAMQSGAQVEPFDMNELLAHQVGTRTLHARPRLRIVE